MMQFLWRYVDELVGKGLELTVLAQFFFYSALTLIPISLPLAILLTALITFGNFGERYELLAMKAAGIPLLRIIRPLIIFCTTLTCISFYFQNVISPKSQKELWTLLVSMKQTSPELDIPEGVFYDQIDGYNIYVKSKDRKTGIMKDVLIYNFSEGFENARIIWANKGKLEMTADKQHLYLHLYDGEEFENLRSQTVSSNNVPYRRETFREKHAIIDFNGGFNMVDGSFLSNRSDSKNMIEISNSIDSLSNRIDSIGKRFYEKIKLTTYRDNTISANDSVKLSAITKSELKVDSILESYTLKQKQNAYERAASRVESLASEWNMNSYSTEDTQYNLMKHEIDFYRKITLSLSCLIFFFIGAPLGAIIRKGGLGMPVVVSVIIFILYYIIDSGATRVAKSGEMNILLGVGMSTIVLTPLGIFFTVKSNNDSVVFNSEAYINFFRMLLGLRPSRHIFKKEVIINDPTYPSILKRLDLLTKECREYESKSGIERIPNYYKIFTNHTHDDHIAIIKSQLENIIEELSNSKDGILLSFLNRYPIVSPRAHKSPSDKLWINLIIGISVPLGIIFYFRIWRFRRRLGNDLKVIVGTNEKIKEHILNNIL